MPRLTEQDIRQIKEILSTNHGPCPVYFNIKTPENGEYVLKSRKIMAKPSPALMSKLSDIIGVENIWIDS